MKSIFERLDGKKSRLDSCRPLPTAIVSKLREYFLVAWTYNSNAIEGSSITLNETRAILLDGVTVDGKPLREHLEVINHHHAIDLVEALANKKEPITEMVIREIHSLVLRTIDDENAGSYRKGNVRIAGSNFVPPDVSAVPALMHEFGLWLSSEKTRKLHPVEAAALAHFKLVDIHPFLDGNGRTARLLMNLFLMREGYPAAVMRQENRADYYKALDTSHTGETAQFTELIARAVEESLDIYLDAIPK